MKGKHPFFGGAEWGHNGVDEMLLARKEVSHDKPDE